MNAIADSCNYFFYEMGYRLGTVNGKYDSATGLKKIEPYATKLGLNMKSGVEITEREPHFSTESAIPLLDRAVMHIHRCNLQDMFQQ